MMTGNTVGNHLLADYLRSETKQLLELVSNTKERIAALESEIDPTKPNLNGSDLSDLTNARRIFHSLEKRIIAIRSVYRAEDQSTWHAVHDLLERPIIVPHDPMTSVLGAAPIGELSPDQWGTTLESMLSRVEKKLKKRA